MRITITPGALVGADVPQTVQEVYVNGSLRKDIECHAIQATQGLGGWRATFTIPQSAFDEDSDFLVLAEIVVYACHEDESTGTPLFRGMVDSIDGHLAIGADEIGFSARSYLGWLDRVQLGQATLSGTFNFRRVDRTDGSLRNWTVRTMVEEAFNSTNYPEDWNGVIALGDTSALQAGTTSQPMATDVEMSAPTYADFLAHMLSLAGDIAVRERFTSSLTYLDFYRLGPDAGTSTSLRVAAQGESITTGANVAELDSSRDLSGIASRCIGYAAAKRMVVTISTDPDEDEDPLVPLWENATAYGAPGPLTAGEQAILDDPEAGNPGHFAYQPGYEFIFRRFALPAALRNFSLDDSLAVEDDEGRPLPMQAFLYRPNVEDAVIDGIPSTQADGTYDDDGTLLSLAGVDGRAMAFTLSDPAVEFVRQALVGEVVGEIRARAHVYFTCCLSLPGHEGGYDTGVRGSATPDALSDSGLMAPPLSRPDLEVSQFTSMGLGLDDVQAYFATYFDADAGSWVTVSTQTTIRDDRPTVAKIAEAQLRSSGRPRRTFAVTLEYLARGLQLGASLRINNGGTMLPAVQIQGIAYSVSEDPKTYLICTDAIPEEVILPDPSRGRTGMATARAQLAGRAAAGLGDGKMPTVAGALGIPSQGEMIAGVADSAERAANWMSAQLRLATNPMQGPPLPAPQLAPGKPGLRSSRVESLNDIPRPRG